jgi:hypothetical protein
MDRLKRIGESLLSWSWTKSLLYWVILSAGTASDLAFILASMWMSENSADHPLMLKIMTEDWTKTISWFATAAYVGLPVLVLPLAILTTLTHARTWIHQKKRICGPAVWCILYGLPTLVFLTLDVITVACSVLSVNFELPPYLIVARALSAYVYAMVALMFLQIGKQQEVDRLKEKDLSIANLQERIQLLYEEKQEQIRNLTLQIEGQDKEVLQLKTLLLESQNQQMAMQMEVKKGTDEALQAYGEDCINWLFSGAKTATIEAIHHYTGHSKQRIAKAKQLKRSRNPDLILMDSIIEWLKETPPPNPQLHIVNG